MKSAIYNFFQNGLIIEHKRGNIIINPNSIPSGVFYIIDGYIKEYTFTESGEEKVSCIYKKGEIIPLLWVFKNSPITKFYEALNTVTIAVRAKQDFLKIVNQPVAMKELMNILVVFIDLYTHRVDNLEFSSVKARLLSRLIFLARRFGAPSNGQIILDSTFNQKVIAESINTSRETVNRLLRDFAQKNLIVVKNETLQIININLLEEELSLVNSI